MRKIIRFLFAFVFLFFNVYKDEALDANDAKRSLETFGTKSGPLDYKAVPENSRKLMTSVSEPTQLFDVDAGSPDHVEYTETMFGVQVLMTLDHSGCKSKSPPRTCLYFTASIPLSLFGLKAIVDIVE